MGKIGFKTLKMMVVKCGEICHFALGVLYVYFFERNCDFWDWVRWNGNDCWKFYRKWFKMMNALIALVCTFSWKTILFMFAKRSTRTVHLFYAGRDVEGRVWWRKKSVTSPRRPCRARTPNRLPAWWTWWRCLDDLPSGSSTAGMNL